MVRIANRTFAARTDLTVMQVGAAMLANHHQHREVAAVLVTERILIFSILPFTRYQ